VEKLMQRRIIEGWQRCGVTIEQPDTVRIEASVSIGADVLIHAGCQLLGSTRIGAACELGPYAVLKDAQLADRVKVNAFSHIEQASAASYARIGPYARLRPGAQLHESAGIGNFVEIKKSVIGRGSKVNHLSYVGDTVMGAACNVGAGTITCNYDGANKYATEIGNNVFIGSDTQLVAPVKVADDATIGAGSTITRDVAEGGLTLSARNPQKYVAGWKRPKKDKS
jgi:bifunctional UDP-N-acetylglucosamine pyrophosphorylase/glucosamine-1-phosphate N-acetyltransferase